mmetsp:Transcript_23099/g.48411  ORF Transcript_23099/g.48411 Transcript_23099/m.48411 type:complete len:123 (+) Transcript_23099:49-417(+)
MIIADIRWLIISLTNQAMAILMIKWCTGAIVREQNQGLRTVHGAAGIAGTVEIAGSPVGEAIVLVDAVGVVTDESKKIQREETNNSLKRLTTATSKTEFMGSFRTHRSLKSIFLIHQKQSLW